MPNSKLLLVDNDLELSDTISTLLTLDNFEVSVANDVPGALKKITEGSFDVLLSDLHLPGPGDGLTIASAMRHTNPNAVTILWSDFPAIGAATEAILAHADEILLKPTSAKDLVELIKQRLIDGPKDRPEIESIEVILARTAEETIAHWYRRVQKEPRLMAIPMSRETRTGHLPEVFDDLGRRLRTAEVLETKAEKSSAALRHGEDRRRQGYSAAMMVEESRLLQVSVFETLQNNLANIELNTVLLSVMLIADEIDAQLSQAMTGYDLESRASHVSAEEARDPRYGRRLSGSTHSVKRNG